MSDKYPEFFNALKNMGHNIIPSDTVDTFLIPEQNHADMQILMINNETFILNECKTLKRKLELINPTVCSKKVGKSYPENILLNFLYFKNCLFGKAKYIDNSVKEFCKQNNIKIVNVNQGYCRCSTLVVSDNAVITADSSIEKALKNNGAEVLKISPGHINLPGFDYGFIGGASGKIDKNTIVFFGNIQSHPDYRLIEAFCEKHNVKIKSLCINYPLTDIGSIVKINKLNKKAASQ